MSRRSRSNVRDTLKKDWRRWTDTIERIALRKSTRRRIDPRAYASLRGRLIASCRDLADSSDDSGRRDYYASLEATVRPWVSPRALTLADREILGQLLDRCRRIERELGGRFGVRAVLRRVAPVLLLIAALSTLVAVSWTTRSLWLPVAEAAQEWWGVNQYSMRATSNQGKLFALGVILILVSIYNVSRTARS